MERSEQPDDEHDTGRHAEDEVGEQELSGALDVEFAPDQDKLDRQRRHQGEGGDVMEEKQTVLSSRLGPAIKLYLVIDRPSGHAAVCVIVLEASSKGLQAPVEARRIIPKGCVTGVRHYVNLRVSNARLVLVDDGRLDNGIGCAMRDQHRFADAGQELIIVERAREQSLPDIRRYGQSNRASGKGLRLMAPGGSTFAAVSPGCERSLQSPSQTIPVRARETRE